MPDNIIPYWGYKVARFGTSYDAEDDIIIFIPISEDGEQFKEEAVAMDPDLAKIFLEQMMAEYPGIMDIRRSVRKAKKKGISAEVVQNRYRDIVIAEDVDEALRMQSMEDKE